VVLTCVYAGYGGCCAQNYFTRILEDDLKAVIKPQYVDHIPKAVRGNVEEVLDGKDQRGIKQYLLDHLDLTQVRVCVGGWGGGNLGERGGVRVCDRGVVWVCGGKWWWDVAGDGHPSRWNGHAQVWQVACITWTLTQERTKGVAVGPPCAACCSACH
jgi:hypothetical protein